MVVVVLVVVKWWWWWFWVGVLGGFEANIFGDFGGIVVVVLRDFFWVDVRVMVVL